MYICEATATANNNINGSFYLQDVADLYLIWAFIFLWNIGKILLITKDYT